MIMYMQFSRRLLHILFVWKTDHYRGHTTISFIELAIDVSNLGTIIGVLVKKSPDIIPMHGSIIHPIKLS